MPGSGRPGRPKKEKVEDAVTSVLSEDNAEERFPHLFFEEDGDEKDSSSSPEAKRLSSIVSARRDRIESEKPAELFRKDLISAMKLPDSDQLQDGEYFYICDAWRQDWERGVQVPVNQRNIHEPSFREVDGHSQLFGLYPFKLPARKFLHAVQDELYKPGIHELHDCQKLAEQVVRYDLDNLDVAWLTEYNEEMEGIGEPELTEYAMEMIFEELETQCFNNMQTMIKTVEGLGIEYDEDVVCDVCRSPESEDNNEMVFCDACDMCVHQACYGIQTIPEGSWLCRTCALGIKPICILCPHSGGAMKSTKSGTKWAHVSCGLWIPEVSIGCPEKMEPITKISQIPSSRWNLICQICRERAGACIQCSVRTCKTSFHVTCAFQNGLDMKTILDEDTDDVQLKAFCQKHSKRNADGPGSPRKSEPGSPRKIEPGSPRKSEPGSPRKPEPGSSRKFEFASFRKVESGSRPATPKKESEMTEEEKSKLRSTRLQKLQEEFFTCVKSQDVANSLRMDPQMVDFVFNYWVLKRRANFNKPLLTPKTEEAEILSRQREDILLERMKMFIRLRQDLERVRNLCYMLGKREKIRRQLYKMKEEIFEKQVQIAEKDVIVPGTRDFACILGAHKLCGNFYDNYDRVLRNARALEAMDVTESSVSNGTSSSDEGSQRYIHRSRQRPRKLKRRQRVRASSTKLLAGKSTPQAAKEKPATISKADAESKLETPTQRTFSSTCDSGRTGRNKKHETVSAEISTVVKEEASHIGQASEIVVIETHRASPVTFDMNRTGRGKKREYGETPTRSSSEQCHLSKPGRSKRTELSRFTQQLTNSNVEAVDENSCQSHISQSTIVDSINDRNLDIEENVQTISSQVGWSTDTVPEDNIDVVELDVNTQEESSVAKLKPSDSLPRSQNLKAKGKLKRELENNTTSDKPLSKRKSVTRVNRGDNRELNGLFARNQLVVSEEIKEKVQTRLRRRKSSGILMNGLCDGKHRRLNNYIQNICKIDSKENEKASSIGVLGGLALTSPLLSAIPESSNCTAEVQTIILDGGSTLRTNDSGYPMVVEKRMPETRSARRRIESDLESEGSEHIFESVDGEVSLRSSRDGTPDRNSPSLHLRKNLDLVQLANENHIKRRLHELSGTSHKSDPSLHPVMTLQADETGDRCSPIKSCTTNNKYGLNKTTPASNLHASLDR